MLTLARKEAAGGADRIAAADARKADIALEIQSAIVDVLAAKALAALAATGPPAARRRGRCRREPRAARAPARVVAARDVYFPDLAFCTDNGAMIALVGALRLAHATRDDHAFEVRPRWELASLTTGTPARAA